MKKSLTETPKEIRTELISLIKNKTALTMCQKNSAPRKIRIKALEKNKDQPNLLLAKTKTFNANADEACVLFYTPFNKPMHGLTVSVIKESNNHLEVDFPNEIFLVERRRFPRISTSGNSLVTFVLKGGTVTKRGQVLDVSKEGARFKCGCGMRKNDIIGPLTFTLRMKFSEMEEVVVVTEARVVRVSYCQDGEEKYSLHFNAGDADQNRLEHYIYMRELEEDPDSL